MSDRVRIPVLLAIVAVFLFVSISSQSDKAEAANKELTTRNAYAFLMPLVELYTETDPVIGETKTIHSEIFRKYIENIESHQLSLPLKPFALKAKKIDVTELESIHDKVKDEVSREVYQAAIEKYFGDLRQFLDKESMLSRESYVPDEKREEVAGILTESNEKTFDYTSSVDASDENKIKESVTKAEKACLASRLSVCHSFLASYTYENFFVSSIVNTKHLILFREDLDRIIYHNTRLSDSLPDKDKTDEETAKKYNSYRIKLYNYSRSESRRRDLVQAVIDDDMQRAQSLLLAAMEKAISEKKEAISEKKVTSENSVLALVLN